MCIRDSIKQSKTPIADWSKPPRCEPPDIINVARTPAEYRKRVALNDCKLATLWGTTLDLYWHRRRHGDRRVRGWVHGKHYYIQLDCDKSNMSTLTSQLGPFSDDTEYNHRNYNFCRMPLSPKWATPGLGSDFAMSPAKNIQYLLSTH